MTDFLYPPTFMQNYNLNMVIYLSVRNISFTEQEIQNILYFILTRHVANKKHHGQD